MAVIRVVKDKNFITMGKYHLQEKEMSLKAKGLLSQMLSLPDNWDYSIVGLTKINKDGLDSIKATLKELEQFGYLKRTRIKGTGGKYIDIEYTIYEKPQVENPLVEKPYVENPPQLNNKELNNKNNKEKNIKKKVFTKPTLEEVEKYVIERKSSVDAKRFYDYYEVADWDGVKNWKQKLITWESHQPKQKKKSCEITDEDLARIEKEIEEEERLNESKKH